MAIFIQAKGALRTLSLYQHAITLIVINFESLAMKLLSFIGITAINLSLLACGGGSTNTTSNSTSINATTGTTTNTNTNTNTTSNSTSTANSEYDLTALGIPRITTASYIDLSKITRISKFRSSIGHSYVDSLESCRSMKHYFATPDNTVNIYSPVDGHVTKLEQEWAGTQVRIQSSQIPAVTFILFHVNLSLNIKVGDPFKAGQLIGQHIGTQTFSDVAVEINTKEGRRLVSYFETLNEQSFMALQAKGITSRQQLVISKQERDAAPLLCNGETFIGTDSLNNWVNL